MVPRDRRIEHRGGTDIARGTHTGHIPEPAEQPLRALWLDPRGRSVQNWCTIRTPIAQGQNPVPRATTCLLERNMEKVEPRLPRGIYLCFDSAGKSRGSPD